MSKRVVTVPDATVLDWFRRGWDHDDPWGWIDSELGGEVYGLDSIFEERNSCAGVTRVSSPPG